MKDLHIKLSPKTASKLGQLSIYTESTYSDLIRTMINIAYDSALTQVYLSKKYPDKLPDDIEPGQSYALMHITNIFDELYGEIPDIEDEEEREIEVEV